MYTSDVTRITGLSGIDTDSLVEQMMKAESIRYDNLYKKKQWTSWQQTAYRDVISSLQKFQNTYFSSSSPSTNFRYSTSFQNFKSTITQGGKESNAITINSTSQSGNYEIDVKQLAEKSSYIATQNVSKKLSGTMDIAGAGGIVDTLQNLSSGESLNVSFTLDGVSKNIELTQNDLNGTSTNATNFLNNLNTKLKDAFGTETINGVQSSKVSVNSVGGKLSFDVSAGHTLSVQEGTSNRADTSSTIALDRLGADGKFTGTSGTYSFNVNIGSTGPYTVDVELNNGDSAKTIASKLNSALSKAKLNGQEKSIRTSLSFSVSADGTNLEIKNTGTIQDVTITNSTFFNQISNSSSNVTLKHTGSLVDLGLTSGASNKIDGNMLVKDIFGSNIDSSIVDSDGNFSLNINGAQIDLNVNDNLKTFMNKVNKSDAGVTLSYNNVSEKFKIEAKSGGAVNEITFGDSTTQDFFKDCLKINTNVTATTTIGDLTGSTGAISLNINNVNINVNSADTIQDFVTNVNNALNAAGEDVTVKFDSNTKEFTIESPSDVTADDSTTAFFNNLFNSHVSGKDAIFSVDGVETTRASNDVDVNGLKFTINEVTNGDSIKVNTEYDEDVTFDKIKKFVEDYNTLIADLNSKISEKRAKSGKYDHYEPLTEEERKALSDDEVKQWEEKAKTGLLYRDSSISNLLSNMRSIMYTPVDLGNGSTIALYEIGITTSQNYADNGKLVIDEEKFKEAIKERGADIETLFTKSETGLADSINKALEGAIGTKGSLRQKAGIEGTSSVNENVLSKQLDDLDEKLADMKEYLYNKEMEYYNMFASMESVISQQNSQMNALVGMLG